MTYLKRFTYWLCSWNRDQGEVLAEALKIMLCEDRQHDMQKAAAFVKRLATFSLCSGSAESMAGMFLFRNKVINILLWISYSCSPFESFAALVTLKHLLLKNVKCRNLLENDAGGGSVSGSVAVSSHAKICFMIFNEFEPAASLYF